MIRNPEYNEFLDFMCPDARGFGMTPPPGTDAALCPRAIIGTYDDHDFGWNDGDGRLEQKWVLSKTFVCRNAVSMGLILGGLDVLFQFVLSFFSSAGFWRILATIKC